MFEEGLSVIIVSWNTKSITDECLASLKKAVDKNTEVIVVDNASTDGTAGMIKKKYPWVKLIMANENLGFAKGNNLGFKKTNPKNKYLLLLNSDAFVKEDTLKKSLGYFNQNNSCDVMGCKLESRNGSLLPSGGFLPTPVRVFMWMAGMNSFGVHPKNKNFFAKEKEVGWVQGAYLFMRREVFEKTDGFDDNFFMYMEEVEWCKRAKNLGYTIFYNPKISAIHLDKASALGIPENLIKVYGLEILGLKYYLKKYYPNHLFYLLPVIRIGVFARLFAFIITGNKLRAEAYRRILGEL